MACQREMIWTYVGGLHEADILLRPVCKESAPPTQLLRHAQTLPYTMREYCNEQYHVDNWDAMYFRDDRNNDFMCLVMFFKEQSGEIETLYQLYRHTYHMLWHYQGNYDDVCSTLTTLDRERVPKIDILNINSPSQEVSYMCFNEYYQDENKKMYFVDEDENYWMVVTNVDSLDAYKLE